MSNLQTKTCVMMSPCEDCPYRSDVRPYLRPGRAAELVSYARQGLSFSCHETTEAGGAEPGSKTKHCAGWALLARKGETLGANQMVRIEERLGANYDEVRGEELIYEDGAAMMKAYVKAGA